MTLDRTNLTARQAEDFATLADINNAYSAINNLKANAGDASATDGEIARGSTTANDRGLRFWQTATTYLRFWWDNTNSIFKFTDEAGVLKKVTFANGTAATHGITKAQLDAAIAALQLEVTGAIKLYGGLTAPTGYLLCDGTAVDRTTYSALFNVISTSFGAGNNTTTFNLPDLRGRFPLGLDNMGGVTAGRITSASLNGNNATLLGGAGGAQTHTLTVPEIPAHTHSYNAGGIANSGQTVNGASSAPTAQTSGSTGGGGAHNNMPPWLALSYIIKT